jgi:hypothetical protein
VQGPLVVHAVTRNSARADSAIGSPVAHFIGRKRCNPRTGPAQGKSRPERWNATGPVCARHDIRVGGQSKQKPPQRRRLVRCSGLCWLLWSSAALMLRRGTHSEVLRARGWP